MDIITLIENYKSLGIPEIIDHEKYNLISNVHHSTSIEGSTLTELETQVLLSEGLTPKGKPMQDSLMVTDHYQALKFTLKEAHAKRGLSVGLIQEINALVNRCTGAVYDSEKVERETIDMVLKVKEVMSSDIGINEQLTLSFDIHFNLVSIHPFYDGNGRTSRLLMNYIQRYFDLPLAMVYNESKANYIQALRYAREKDTIEVFRSFMRDEYTRYLQSEIQKFEEMSKPTRGQGFNLMF